MDQRIQKRFELLNYRIVVPSRGRYDVIGQKTFKLLPSVTYLVPVEEEEQYRLALGPETDIHTTTKVGVVKTMADIWERFPEESVMVVDDDVLKVVWINGMRTRTLTTEEEIVQAIENMVRISQDLGITLCTANNSMNPMYFSTFQPFSLSVRNPWAMKAQTGKRLPIDPDINAMLDPFLIMETMLRDHCMFTDCRLHFYVGTSMVGKGGNQLMRSSEGNMKDESLLKAKYGSSIRLGKNIGEEVHYDFKNTNDKVKALFK